MIKMEQILALSEEIAREFKPERIILFGSYAYGVPEEDSDIDILVVLPFSEKPSRKALEIVGKIKPMIPLDLIARTPEQVSERIANNDWLMRDVMEKGQTLYEDNHT
ncbi:MAG TPA: nucleotidyltransferase domain-containing protein [Pyrinomonadaceae bacterium]|jgi:predicted nucleotidyltransferase